MVFILLCASHLSATETNASVSTITNLTAGTIVFERDVRPIFEHICFRCHGPAKPKSDFRLDNRIDALRGGGNNTNDIVPGHSDQSKLISYVSGLDPEIFMPPPAKFPPLSAGQIDILRRWIDEGASWGTNAHPTALLFSAEPSMRWTSVQGDTKKFRELQGIREGTGGGVDHFFSQERLAPDETLTIEGHALMPENDLKIKIALDRANLGFIHSGFEEWRRYYDDTGGFYPQFTPPSYSLGQDLHLDIGRAWIDFGLSLPEKPQLVVGYEFQFRQGDKSTLEWGTVSQNGLLKNIYPDAEHIDEYTHVIKVDVTHEWYGWEIENRARVEIYDLGEQRNDALLYTTGPSPDIISRVNQNVDYVQGANTFRMEKQIEDWWRFCVGGLYSQFDGTSYLDQNTLNGAGMPTFGSSWSTEGITLRRDSRVFSLSSLFLPVTNLTISAAIQVELTHQEGFGDVNLDFGDPSLPGYQPFPGRVNANQNRTRPSEDLVIQYTRLPHTVLFATSDFRQENVSQFDVAINSTADAFKEQTDAQNHFYDVRAGFTSSPWSWMEIGGHCRRCDSSTSYGHNVDDSPFNGEGYPAFIQHRDIATDELQANLALRPAYWLQTRLTYRFMISDYTTTTDPVSGVTPISPGGSIDAGQTTSDDIGVSLMFTPVQQFYLSTAFTYGYSTTTTAHHDDPAIVPYSGNTITVDASAGYALNAKTDLKLTYIFSEADYGQNNPAGVPLGLDFQRNSLLVGLTRKFTDRFSGTLRYGFFQYSEPSGGNRNDFTAQGVFASITYRWP
jgi:hypothetical protein